jgi:hypothetical protein
MPHRIIAPVSAILCLAAISACTAEGAPELSAKEDVGQSSQADVSCPVISSTATYEPGNADLAQGLAAATVAFNLMKLAATEAQASGNLLAARSILAPQRYTYLPGTSVYSWGTNGPGIQFDPSDPLYSHVTNAMKAELAFAQSDATVGSYLSAGLWRARAYTNGQYYPSIFAVPALAQYQAGKTTIVHLEDSTSADDSHDVKMSNTSWCNDTAVRIAETVNKSWAYQPIALFKITDWRSAPSGYTGVAGGVVNGQTITSTGVNDSYTPFMGSNGQSPYLLVSINGSAQNWLTNNGNYGPINCWDNPYPTFTCQSAMEIDPVPYAEPGAYYDANNNLVGPQINPYALAGTQLYADPAHQGQWATRVANSVQEWGTFSKPVTLFGTTKYQYVKQM